MNKTFLGADLSFFNQSYSGGITATKKPTGYWRYYHSKCRPSRVMRAAMEPGVHTMSDELILQISCNIFLAFKWMLMMTSGQNISHYRTAKLSVHVWNHDLIWWQNKIDTLHVLSSSPNIHSSFRLSSGHPITWNLPRVEYSYESRKGSGFRNSWRWHTIHSGTHCCR